MMFSIEDFFNNCDQICSFLWIWSDLLKKSWMENFVFCAEQEVGDDLSVCLLNILPKVSSLMWPHVTSPWSLDQKVMFGSLLL